MLGIALISWPGTVLELAAVGAGVLLILAAIAEILRLTGRVRPSRRRVRGRPSARAGRGRRALLVAGAGVGRRAGGARRPTGGASRTLQRLPRAVRPSARTRRVRGDAQLDGRRQEPGWLFAAQDAGIHAQLDDGIRALLIDTHYGFATPRGVATELAAGSSSREKVASGGGGGVRAHRRAAAQADRVRRRRTGGVPVPRLLRGRRDQRRREPSRRPPLPRDPSGGGPRSSRSRTTPPRPRPRPRSARAGSSTRCTAARRSRHGRRCGR